MPRIYQNLPPEGSGIAIAFSGGLDTRAAVAWLTKKGMRVHSYTADLAQPDEENVAAIPGIADDYGAVASRLIDCSEDLANEGILAIQCGAFHISSAGSRYYNTTPLGRAITTTAIVQAMKADGVHIFGDGSTHKGNDIQRFYRYGVLVHPGLSIYKPWLDEAFVSELGGRTEMSEYLDQLGKPYHMQKEKAYSTDANMLGATHEAKHLEFLDQSMHIVEPIMGLPFWDQSIIIEPETVSVEFKNGKPVKINGAMTDTAKQAILLANKVGGRHGLGMSDQIENRVIEAKSRGIYEAPGMSLLSLAYERLLSAIHNESTMDLYFNLGRKLGRLLYEGRWYDPEATALKQSLQWVALPVNGTVTFELRRGNDFTILNTVANPSTYTPEKLSMEKTQGGFGPRERSGALELHDNGIFDNRTVTKYIQDNVDFKDQTGIPDLQ